MAPRETPPAPLKQSPKVYLCPSLGGLAKLVGVVFVKGWDGLRDGGLVLDTFDNANGESRVDELESEACPFETTSLGVLEVARSVHR